MRFRLRLWPNLNRYNERQRSRYANNNSHEDGNLSLGISVVADELRRFNYHRERDDNKNYVLQIWGLLLIAGTLIATIITAFLFYRTMIESRESAKKAHDDSIASLDAASFSSWQAVWWAHFDGDAALKQAQTSSSASLNVSERANKVAADATIISNRASLFVDHWEFFPVVNKEGALIAYNVDPVMMNIGHTATKNMRWNINRKVISPATINIASPDVDIAKESDGFFADMPTSTIIHNTVVRANNGTISLRGVGFAIDEIDLMAQNKATGVIWGWVEYNDIFPDTPCHRTRFAIILQITGDYKGDFRNPSASPLEVADTGHFDEPADICTH